VPVPDGSDFPLENLPFGVARVRGGEPHVVVRIGDHVVDVSAAGIAREVTAEPALNALMASGRGAEVRNAVAELLVGAPRDHVVHLVTD
jgi:fumarylacetoacetase